MEQDPQTGYVKMTDEEYDRMLDVAVREFGGSLFCSMSCPVLIGTPLEAAVGKARGTIGRVVRQASKEEIIEWRKAVGVSDPEHFGEFIYHYEVRFD